MQQILLNKKIKRIDPNKTIGKGGEADIYDVGKGQALKLFKQPDHPDLINQDLEQQKAKARLKEHQKKLPAFPDRLPIEVITPISLAYDNRGKNIVGYSMDFFKGAEVLYSYSDKDFRKAGISNEQVVKTFKSLHSIISDVHNCNVVIGDFNDLNIMIRGDEIRLIDADSFQYGKFLCKTYTIKFVDPLLCDPTKSVPELIKPHCPNSDWYAFNIMLMQSLLFVGPYGGVYRPKNKKLKVKPDERSLRGITVFNPEVKYPKPAIPYKVLSDELLHHFHSVFEDKERGVFPIKLLNEMRWIKCDNCGYEHARPTCPECATAVKGIVKSVTVVKDNVTATRIFTTKGVILFSTSQKGNLRWLYHEDGEFKRENKNKVISGKLDTQMRFRISGSNTLVAKNGQCVVLANDSMKDRFTVDSLGILPICDGNGDNYFWSHNGQLLRNDTFGNKHIGNILQGQTLFWVGDKFGFGFYRAGNLNVAFVFDTHRSGINDSIKIPPINGQLVDSTCAFSANKVWFFYSVKTSGKILNNCMVINNKGGIEGSCSSFKNEGDWLSNIRGNCAAGNFLFCATDEGVVRIEIDANDGSIQQTKIFTATEQFVDSNSKLFITQDGLGVVNSNEIYTLKIK